MYVYVSRGGGGGRLLVSCVPMREQKKPTKTMRNGAFYELGSEQRCHHLGLEKCYFCRKRVCFVTFFIKGCRIRE